MIQGAGNRLTGSCGVAPTLLGEEAHDVLDYLLAVLIAPLVRRLIVFSFRLCAFAFAVTIPARLWVRYLDPKPSAETVVVLNAAGLGLLLWILGLRYRW
jgi:hypothetical protein